MCIQIDCNMYLTKLQNVFPQVRKMHLSKLRKLFDFALLLLENEDWVEDGFEDDLGRKAKKDLMTMIMMRMEMMTIALMPLTSHQCCIGGG